MTNINLITTPFILCTTKGNKQELVSVKNIIERSDIIDLAENKTITNFVIRNFLYSISNTFFLTDKLEDLIKCKDKSFLFNLIDLSLFDINSEKKFVLYSFSEDDSFQEKLLQDIEDFEYSANAIKNNGLENFGYSNNEFFSIRDTILLILSKMYFSFAVSQSDKSQNLTAASKKMILFLKKEKETLLENLLENTLTETEFKEKFIDFKTPYENTSLNGFTFLKIKELEDVLNGNKINQFNSIDEIHPSFHFFPKITKRMDIIFKENKGHKVLLDSSKNFQLMNLNMFYPFFYNPIILEKKKKKDELIEPKLVKGTVSGSSILNIYNYLFNLKNDIRIIPICLIKKNKFSDQFKMEAIGIRTNNANLEEYFNYTINPLLIKEIDIENEEIIDQMAFFYNIIIKSELHSFTYSKSFLNIQFIRQEIINFIFEEYKRFIEHIISGEKINSFVLKNTNILSLLECKISLDSEQLYHKIKVKKDFFKKVKKINNSLSLYTYNTLQKTEIEIEEE